MTTKLSQIEVNQGIVTCKQGKFSILDLEKLLNNVCLGDVDKLCTILFMSGSSGRRQSCMLEELFANAPLPILRWLTSTIPMPQLCNNKAAPAVLFSLATRPCQVHTSSTEAAGVDELFEHFIPSFFSLVPLSVLKSIRSGTLDICQVLIGVNNKKAYTIVTERIDPNLKKSAELDARTLHLERVEHDLKKERAENAELRFNLKTATMTSEDLVAMHREMNHAIEVREETKQHLQRRLVALDVERTALIRNEELAEKKKADADSKIGASKLARSVAEAQIQAERLKRTQATEELRAANGRLDETKRNLAEVTRKTKLAEVQHNSSVNSQAELQQRIKALDAKIHEAEEQTSTTNEEKLALKMQLEMQIKSLNKELAELAERTATAETNRQHAIDLKHEAEAKMAEQKAATELLRTQIDAMAGRVGDLETQLQEACANQRLSEHALDEARQQLGELHRDREQLSGEHAKQVSALRKENEARAAEVAETQRLLRAAAETVAHERERAENASQQLAATASEAAQNADLVVQLKLREEAIMLELEESRQRAEDSERKAALSASEAATSAFTAAQIESKTEEESRMLTAKLAEVQDRLAQTRTDLRQEKDTQLELEKSKAELERRLAEMAKQMNDLVTARTETTTATLSSIASPRPTHKAPNAETAVAPQRPSIRMSGSRMNVFEQTGGTPSPRALIRKQSTFTMRRSSATPSEDEALCASVADANDNEIVIALANHRANRDIFKNFVDAIIGGNASELRSLFSRGISANTRDQHTRQTALEIAVKTAHAVHRSHKRAGKESAKIAEQMAAIIGMILERGGEWGGLENYVAQLERIGFDELSRAGKKQPYRIESLATQLPKVVIEKLDERDELAPFCQAILKASASNVKKYIGSVTDIDRIPKQDPARGRAYIHLGVMSGSVSIVYDLVRHGADVTLVDNDGCTPLRLALLKCTNAPDRLKIVEYLLAAGADPEETCEMPEFEESVVLEEGSGSSTMTSAVLGKIRSNRPYRGKAASKTAGTTSLALADALKDHALSECMRNGRFRRVSLKKMCEYVTTSIALNITVEKMLVLGELRTTDIEHRIFEMYGSIFYSFNEQFEAKNGENFTRRQMRKALQILDQDIDTAREERKFQQTMETDLTFIEAALKSRTSSNKNNGNKTLHSNLLKYLEECLIATRTSLFDVSELILDPAKKLYNEAAQEVLIEKIKEDRVDYVQFIMQRRDRLFGPLDFDTPILDNLTPIECAAKFGTVHTLEWFMRRQQSSIDDVRVNSGKTLMTIAVESEQPLVVVAIDYFKFKNSQTTQTTPNSHNYGIVRSDHHKNTVLHLAVLAMRRDLLEHCLDAVPFHLRTLNAARETPLKTAENLQRNSENRDADERLEITACVGILKYAVDQSASQVSTVVIEPFIATEDDDGDPPPPPPPPALQPPPPLESRDSAEEIYEQATLVVVDSEGHEAEESDTQKLNTSGKRRKRKTKPIK